jgi:CBS domain-containing protein
MKVKDIMTAPAIQVMETDTVHKAAEIMAARGTGALVVSDKDNFIKGVVTDRDLVTMCIVPGFDPKTLPVGDCVAEDYAGSHPTTVRPDAEIEDAIELMRRAGVHRLPVTEDGLHAVGMLSFDDIALAVKHYLNEFLALAARYHHRKPGE